MKKIAVLASAFAWVFLVLSTPGFAEIRFGVAAESYPPFTYKDKTGNWAGWEVDFMKAVCVKLNETCSIVDVAWEGMVPALNAGKFDVILASMAITEKRRAVIDFSDVYYKSAPQLVAAKGAVPFKTSADISGKRVGVQGSSIHAAYAEKYFAPAGAAIKTYAKQDEVFADLAAGRLDYAMADALALDAFLETDFGACCSVAGAVAFDADVFGPGVGLGLRKQDSALKERLNTAIKTVSQNGDLAAITQNWHLTGKIITAGTQ